MSYPKLDDAPLHMLAHPNVIRRWLVEQLSKFTGCDVRSELHEHIVSEITRVFLGKVFNVFFDEATQKLVIEPGENYEHRVEMVRNLFRLDANDLTVH